MRRDRRRRERGSALVEVTWLAILLLVPLVYVVLSVYQVQRASFAATSAARSAGRAFVMAPSPAEARARARAAAAAAFDDQGVESSRADLTIGCQPSCLVPGSVATVHVTYQVRLPLMPSALGGDTPSIRVRAEHTVPYGTFREDRS